jgi:hypothetical protein
VARAKSGKYFCETIGISIAVGMVLGASTLPCYSQPETQLKIFASDMTCEADVFMSGFSITNDSNWFDDLFLGPSQIKSPNTAGLGGSVLRVSSHEQLFCSAQVIDITFSSVSKSLCRFT